MNMNTTNNLQRQEGSNNEYVKTVDRILNEGEMMEWFVDCIKNSISDFGGKVLKTRENREYCEYVQTMCGYVYRMHLYYWLRR